MTPSYTLWLNALSVELDSTRPDIKMSEIDPSFLRAEFDRGARVREVAASRLPLTRTDGGYQSGHAKKTKRFTLLGVGVIAIAMLVWLILMGINFYAGYARGAVDSTEEHEFGQSPKE